MVALSPRRYQKANPQAEISVTIRARDFRFLTRISFKLGVILSGRNRSFIDRSFIPRRFIRNTFFGTATMFAQRIGTTPKNKRETSVATNSNFLQ